MKQIIEYDKETTKQLKELDTYIKEICAERDKNIDSLSPIQWRQSKLEEIMSQYRERLQPYLDLKFRIISSAIPIYIIEVPKGGCYN